MSESSSDVGPVAAVGDRGDLPAVDRSPWYQRLAERFGVRLSLGVLGLIILGLLVLSVILFPYLLVPGLSKSDMSGLMAEQRITANNDLAQTRNAVRTTLVQAIGGALLIVSGGIAWAQVQTARRGQLTDRLTKSVDQLGNTRREVRLGGIYALKQVADSPQYTRAVAEVLLAYLRTASLDSGTQANGQTAARANVPLTDSSPTNWADLQAVLRILVTEKLWLRSEAGRLDLSSISVPFAPLQGAELSGSVMVGAKLPNANLRQARLVQADMENADLERADLAGADLSGARLIRSNLTRASIGLASPERPTKLQNVQAGYANFSEADLSGSDLGFGVFHDANFSKAKMYSANLRNADFRNAILKEVHFNRADLSRADFTGADLSGADFSGANLSGAILRDVVIVRVTADPKTKLDAIEADDSIRAQLQRAAKLAAD